jgi:hypothetical protein
MSLEVFRESFEKSCLTCRSFGKTIDYNRTPSGQCRKKAPGVYHVRETRVVSMSETVLTKTIDVVEVPFPGVWPTDCCDEYQPRNPPSLADELGARVPLPPCLGPGPTAPPAPSCPRKPSA